MKMRIGLGIALMVGLALAGCRRADTVYVGKTVDGQTYRWIQTDNNLRYKAEIVSARRDRENGLLRVQVDLRNTRYRTERIIYRFSWFDEKGIEVPSIQSTWTVRTLNGGETIQITGIAPDPRVTDSMISIMEASR